MARRPKRIDVAAEEREARIEQARAARIADLWRQPHMSDSEIPDALKLAPSSWQLLKARGDGPRLFSIGKRTFARTEDLRAWLDSKVGQ